MGVIVFIECLPHICQTLSFYALRLSLLLFHLIFTRTLRNRYNILILLKKTDISKHLSNVPKVVQVPPIHVNLFLIVYMNSYTNTVTKYYT